MVEMAIALALLITLIQASLWLLEKISFKSWADNTTAQIASCFSLVSFKRSKLKVKLTLSSGSIARHSPKK